MLLRALAGALFVVSGASAPPGDDGGHREIVLRAREEGSLLGGGGVVDELVGAEVVVVRVEGVDPFASGVVHQCTRGGSARCWNRFPVQFGDDGRAEFQYELVDPGTCGPTDACVLVVEVDGAEIVAPTVFGAKAPPPPKISLSPAGPYEEGDVVAVSVIGAAPGVEVAAAACHPECGRSSTTRVGADGTATVEVRIGTRCSGCGIAVVAGTAEQFFAVRFAPAPTADYDFGRLVAGLAAAAALLFVAWRLIVTVDWRPPSEAATPQLDSAEL